MELIVDDSPLAHYLEGKGTQEHHDSDISFTEQEQDFTNISSTIPRPRVQSFAPQGRPTLSRQSSSFKSTPLDNADDTLSRIKSVGALAVSSTLGKADNHRFLEHFRYIIIASQLLAPNAASANRKSTQPVSSPPQPPSSIFQSIALGPGGILLAALVASPLIYILRWMRTSWSNTFSWTAAILLTSAIALVTSLLYAYARRQWLKSLRKQAVAAASAFVNAMQEYESSAASLLTFVQEVELVSRGYRLSNPLPPVSRLEGNGQNRTCARMRRTLQGVYSTVSPNFISALADLQLHTHDEDLDRFLEVYDVSKDDIEDARVGFIDVQQEELETLRSLRLYQYRLCTLRRLLLCSLLSIPATGRQADAARWRVAVAVMEYLTQLLRDSNALVMKLLQDEQQLPANLKAARPQSIDGRPTSLPVTPSPALPQAIRPISSMTTGVRTLSARLHLLRNSVSSSLSQPRDSSTLSTLASSMREQYDALGDDLTALLKEWEQGRELLDKEIGKQERRVSGLSVLDGRSSPAGLGVVMEDEDGDESVDTRAARANALLALTGEGGARSSLHMPMHLPLSPPISIIDGGSDFSSPMEEKDAVFEAVAIPRSRGRQRTSLSGLTREQRIAKMHEEQQRLQAARRSREVQGDMMNELKTVIGARRPLSLTMRPQRESRITSV